MIKCGSCSWIGKDDDVVWAPLGLSHIQCPNCFSINWEPFNYADSKVEPSGGGCQQDSERMVPR